MPENPADPSPIQSIESLHRRDLRRTSLNRRFRQRLRTNCSKKIASRAPITDSMNRNCQPRRDPRGATAASAAEVDFRVHLRAASSCWFRLIP
jgi:hypothetical protein